MRYDLGKVDYNGSGRRNCRAVVIWDLKEGRFTMQGEIWNPRETDIYEGGQCVDTVAAFFPEDAKAQRMVEIWRRWHLNDMHAGSSAQEAWLREHPGQYGANHYELASRELAKAGLNPDPGYIHKGQPYRYGSAWLIEELPADVVAEIESWSQ